jgi:hypothetical protein
MNSRLSVLVAPVAAVALLASIPPAGAQPPAAVPAAVGSPEVFTDAIAYDVIPGGHLGVWTMCPSGYGAKVLLEWDGAYDTNEPGAYPPPGRVTRANPGTSKRFTVLTVPAKLGNGRSTAGLSIYIRVACAASNGALSYANSEILRVVASSGYPEVNRWKSATKPVRLTLTAPPSASATSTFRVTIRAKNTSSKRWRGKVGFFVYPNAEGYFSLPAFAKVTRGGAKVPNRFVQSFPGGRSPSYRVVRTIKPGKTVTVRFRVMAGTAIYRYLDLSAMRATTALGRASGTTRSIVLS